MSLINRDRLIADLSNRIDRLLATQLVDEFISCERRYIQRDWEPAELDGGQFAEIAARIWYAEDSGNVNLSKEVKDCVRYVHNDQVSHAVLPQQTVKHVFRVLQTVYNFRSQRGAVHISPNYSPNHMDAKLVVECTRWLMNETLRYFWSGDREEVAKTIRELLQFDVPAVGIFDDIVLVQRVDLTAVEEILVLLHYSGDEGLSRKSLGKYAHISPASVTTSIQKLVSSNCRQAVQLSNGNYRLTDLGSKQIRDELSHKLSIQ